jgi:hypothetical protein
VILFELPVESNIELIAFLPNRDQFIMLGDAYASITVTPEKYVETTDNGEWGTSAPGCEGMREWAEGSWAAMKLAQDVISDVQSQPKTVTPADLRSAAASLRATATAQEGLTVPSKARAAHDDIIALIRAGASALDDAAIRIEKGESPETVVKQIDAPRSPFMRAATTAIASLIKATAECPLN